MLNNATCCLILAKNFLVMRKDQAHNLLVAMALMLFHVSFVSPAQRALLKNVSGISTLEYLQVIKFFWHLFSDFISFEWSSFEWERLHLLHCPGSLISCWLIILCVLNETTFFNFLAFLLNNFTTNNKITSLCILHVFRWYYYK